MKKKRGAIKAPPGWDGALPRRRVQQAGLVPAETARMVAFFEHDPLPVCEVGTDGRILFMNVAARRALPGLSPATRSHPWIDGIRDTVLPQFESSPRKVVRREVAVGDRRYEQALHFIRREGRILIYGQDITRRTQAEQAAAERGRQLSAAHQRLREAHQDQQASELKVRAFNQKLSAVSEELQATGKELKVANLELTSAEVELREHAVRTREILMSMTDAYFACDGHWRFISVNPVAARTVFHRPAAELLGREFWAVPPLDHDEAFGSAVREAVAGRRYARFEWHLATDGTWHEAHINPRAGRVDINLRDITEHKRAEQALHENEERYKLLYDSINDSVWIHEMNPDGPGRFLEVNDRCCQRLGYTREEMLAMTVSQIDAPEQVPLIPEISHRLAAEGQAVFETDHLTKDGRRLSMELSVKMITYRGRPAAMAVMRDISDRKRAQQELREEKDRLASLLASITDEVWFADTTGKFTLANPSALRAFGLRPSPSIGVAELARSVEVLRADGSLRPPAEAPPLRALRGEVIQGEEEIIRTPGGGELRYRQVSSAPVRDVAGTIIGSVSVVRDITAAKVAEAGLRESEAKYRAHFNQASDGIIFMPVGSSHITVNESFARMHGYGSPEQMAHLRLEDLDTPETARLAPERLRRMLAGEALDFEVEHRRKDGSTISLQVSSSVIRIGDKSFFLGFHRDITERKRAEDALRDSEARYRQLVKHAPAGIYEFDYRTGRIINANDVMCEYTGYSRDEILRMDPMDLLDGESRVLFRQRLALAQTTGELPENVEYRIRCKDGSFLWGNFLSSYVLVSNRPVLATTIVYNITERKQAEAALRASEQKHRELLQSITTPVLSLRRDLTIYYCNQAYAEFVGRDSGQLIGQRLLDLFPGFERTRSFQAYRQCLDSGAIGEVEGPMGSVYLHAKIYPTAEGLLAVCEDITTRKRAEAALRDSEQRYRALAETSPDMIYTVDQGGFVRYINRTAAKYIGGEPGELAGRHLRECFPLETYERQWRSLRSVLATGQPKYLQGQSQFQGRPFWLDTWLVPLTDPDGMVSLVMGISRDITERKAMEAELQRYRQNLEQQVEQRTNELAQRTMELNATRRLSDIGMLAATVAHELRNPLAAIRMASYNIKHKAQLPALASHLATIDNKVSDCDQIIKNLLFYSRIRTPDYQTFTIDAVLDDVVAAVAERHAGKRIAFTWSDDSARGLQIDADPLLVRELFENLLDNAADAVPESGGRIGIDTAAAEPGRCLVRISDNGPGIEPALVAKVFDPFFSTKSKGTGLGLAVCRQISNLHGGEITLDSELGRGTTVTVSLPRQQADE